MLEGELSLHTRRDLVELRRMVTLYRRFLRELEIKQTGYGGTTRLVARFNQQQLCSVLNLTPQMETIRLKYATRDNVLSWAGLVQVARALCPSVRAIKLPPPKESVFEHNEEHPEVSQQLIEAVTSTIKCPPVQTIRQVHFPVPFVHFPEPHITARNSINRICDLFPNVELLDVYESLLRQDHWYIDPYTWERFCST